jgi:hypothetical protein
VKLQYQIPLCVAAISALAISPVLRAQDGTKSDSTKPEYCSLSKLVGAKVSMSPGAEARREAAKDGEAAKRPKGKVDEVLVDVHDGRLEYAIVSFGGFVGIGDKTVAIPVSQLTWNQAQERFEIDATEDRLKALPAFDLGKARKAGLDNACASLHEHWVPDDKASEATKEAYREAKEASARKIGEAKALDGTSFYVIPARLVCVTEIDDYPVHTSTEKFGKVNDLLVDRSNHTIALAVVKRGGALGMGGTEYLIPFKALHFCTSGEERLHVVNVDTTKLETAVVYEKPKNGDVDPEAAKRALESTTFPVRKDESSR